MLFGCHTARVSAILCAFPLLTADICGAQDLLAESNAVNVPGTIAVPADAQPIQDPLLVQIDEAIQTNGQRFLTANYHSPWQIFHGILAYRKDFQVKLGDQKLSAIDWVATADPRFDGQPLIMITAHGPKFHPYTRPWAFEGHAGQTLALLSESHLPADFQLQASGRKVTIGELLQTVMTEANTREETTWVLWALINYLKVDAQWTNMHGQAWSIEALVQNEVAAHTPTRPCGGNHNLFVLSRARDKYLLTGRPLRGTWFEADQKIRQYIELARSLQNPDGTFSSNFYKGPGYSQDMNTRFNTTGHTFEFLSVGLPDSRLNEQWVRNAAHMLSRELIAHRRESVDCGPLYHSLNGLMIYRNRLRPPVPEPAVVRVDPAATPAPAVVAAPIVAAPVVAMPVSPAPAVAANGSTDQKPMSSASTAPGTSKPVALTTVKSAHGPGVDAAAPHLPEVGPISALSTENH